MLKTDITHLLWFYLTAGEAQAAGFQPKRLAESPLNILYKTL